MRLIPEERAQKNVLNYGRTDGKNLPNVPVNKFFSVGYNQKYGLVDVIDGDGQGTDGLSIFEGAINIEKLLAQLPQRTEETAKQIDKTVETYIMDAYNNLWDYETNTPKYDTKPTPILEVLTRNF